MATTTAPNLLTLQREIRDQIYGYLQREVNVYGDEPDTMLWYKVVLKNAPLVAVLLTHSRLYEEYIQADCFKNLSADADIIFHPLPLQFQPSAADVDACSRVRHLTLRTCNMMTCKTTMIGERLRSNFPNFYTLRLLEFSWAGSFNTDELRLELSAYAKPNPGSPPNNLAGLRLMQSAGAFKYLYWAPESLHQLYRIQVCTYAEIPCEFWTPEQVGFYKNDREYPGHVLEALERQRPGISALLSAKLLGWTDIRTS